MIRDAAPADIAQIGEVFRRASLSNDGDRTALLEHPEVLEFDATCVHQGRTRVAVEDGRVVGFVTTTPNGETAELDDLFVDPDWMRRGIGLSLMRDAYVVARGQGVRRIEVTANHHALAFYEVAGFALDGEADTEFGPAPRMHVDIS